MHAVYHFYYAIKISKNKHQQMVQNLFWEKDNDKDKKQKSSYLHSEWDEWDGEKQGQM